MTIDASDPVLHDTADLPSLDIEIVSGRPTGAEIAAITAVLAVALEEADDRRAAGSGGPSAWDRSQRILRQPIHPGAHAWSGFTV